MPPGNYVLDVVSKNGGGDRRHFSVPAIHEKLLQKPVDLGVLTLKASDGR